MKKSKRLLLRTVAALYCMTGLYVGASRAFMEPVDSDPAAPRRTAIEQLASLRDFTRIDMESDFSVEVTQRADYSIELIGAADDRGDLMARVEAGVLQLRGYGHADGVLVRIGMPQLQQLTADFAPLISVSGFSGDALSIRTSTRPARSERIEMRDNDIENLELRIVTTRSDLQVQLDQASVAHGVAIIGGATLTIVE